MFKKKARYQRYTEDNSTDAAETERYTNAAGNEMMKTLYKDCRFGYGEPLKFDSSGENNLTRGKDPPMTPRLVFDKGGTPSFEARRNHRSVLQESYGCFFSEHTTISRFF